MNQIAGCDWLPERARWSHLACSGLPAVTRKQHFTKSHIINPLLTKFVRSRWLVIGLVLFFASLWTSTSSRSINTQKKKNLANSQPSRPHTWSITHTYFQFTSGRHPPSTISVHPSQRPTNHNILDFYSLCRHHHYIAKIFVYKHCFCYLNFENAKQKNSLFVSPSNSSLVGILITIGDVTNIFAIGLNNRSSIFIDNL